MDYKTAGVDIDEADKFVSMLRERIKKEWPEAAVEIGGFAGMGLVPPSATKFGASTDGVGTKLILAAAMDKLDGVGQDAVAMSAVDTYAAGIKPAYLLDYFATGHLIADTHIAIIDSLIKGCKQAGCRIIGGETAEMPGFFKHEWYIDLVTFVIGFPEQRVTTGEVLPGMRVYGWPSYGPASNGFSLIRQVFWLTGEKEEIRNKLKVKSGQLGEMTLGEALLQPTPIWINKIEEQRSKGKKIAAHAHITGGGLIDNPPRITPKDCRIVIDRSTWQRPGIFQLIQNVGNIPTEKMDRTFNNGIMMISLTSNKLDSEDAIEIGYVEKRSKGEDGVKLINSYQD